MSSFFVDCQSVCVEKWGIASVTNLLACLGIFIQQIYELSLPNKGKVTNLLFYASEPEKKTPNVPPRR